MATVLVRLIHWNVEESAERAARLRNAGYDVDASPVGPAFLKALSANPPDAVVIDLGRLPSQGRDVALLVRKRKATRGGAFLSLAGISARLAESSRPNPW